MFSGADIAKSGSKWGQGTSIDQVYANHVGEQTLFPSLVLGLMGGAARLAMKNRISYKGPNQSIASENDPSKVFDTVFGGFEEDPAAAARLRAQKQSVLDAVQTQLNSLKTKHSTLDGAKLDAHLTSIRGIERRLSTERVGCGGVDAPDLGRNADAPARGRAMIDIMVAAMSCDVTRSISYQWVQEG